MGNSSSVLNTHRAKLNKTGKHLLDQCVQSCLDSKLCDADTALAVEEKLTYLLANHALPPIRMIRLDDLIGRGEFPRCPDDSKLTVELDTIDRNSSLLVFISHCWLRGWSGAVGWDGRPHPDNAGGEKYQLCVEGIKRLKEFFAPRMSECYVWLDFGCINQDGNPAGELEQLDKIVQCCDCIFTPIVDHVNSSNLIPDDFYREYHAALWNDGPHAYVNRGWCRVEMLYAANIPVIEYTVGDDRVLVKRHTLFESGLAYHCSQNRRPHFLFSSNLLRLLNPPHLLPPLQHSFLTEYSPLKGSLSVASDLVHIEQLMLELQPYLDATKVSVGYTGDVNADGQPDGSGVYQYETGDVYEGSWKQGVKCGRGVLRRSSGDVFDGDWLNDGDGKGTVRRATGAVYEGEWQELQLCSEGRMMWPGGNLYEGQWKNNLQNGHGKHSSNCSSQEGDWKDGTMHGHGIYRYADGSVYDGEWQDDKIHGHGVMMYANGGMYVGEWKDEKRHGHGVMKFANGDVYDGEWRDNMRHGHGVLKYTDGSVFDGEWQNHKRHGHGILKLDDGGVYDGEWQDDMKHGHGVMIYANGGVYDGEWQDNSRHGHGVLKYADGGVYDGEWRDDKRHGHGVLKCADGDVYDGEWQNHKRHGRGVLKYADGLVYDGEWQTDWQLSPSRPVASCSFWCVRW